MDRLMNAMKLQSAAQDATGAQPRFAVVSSIDPKTMTARVLLQPEQVLTGWLPVLSPWVGDGWVLCAPPSPGDQVLIIPQEGEAASGAVLAASWSSAANPPEPVAVGEIWLRHRTGTSLRLSNDGTVRVVGDLHVEGEVHDRHGPLSRLRDRYNAHTHLDSRGGRTGGPTEQDR